MPGGRDVHAVVLVRVGSREYLIDAGCAAPLSAPLPRDLDRDLVVAFGRSRLAHLSDGEPRHGYLANPVPRDRAHLAPAWSAALHAALYPARRARAKIATDVGRHSAGSR